MPKKTISQIEVTGKVEKPTQPTTLEQIWGFNELAKYGTNSPAEYEKQLKEMNRPELEAHARKIGVVTLENSERLRLRLVAEFKGYFASLNKPANPNPTKKISDEVRRILAEGR